MRSGEVWVGVGVGEGGGEGVGEGVDVGGVGDGGSDVDPWCGGVLGVWGVGSRVGGG